MAQWHVQGQCHQPLLQLVRWIPNESVRLLPGTGVPRGRRFSELEERTDSESIDIRLERALIVADILVALVIETQ